MISLKTKYTQQIKEEAQRLGFSFCGISKAGFLEEEAPRLEKWLDQNMHGEMQYMENHFDDNFCYRYFFDSSENSILS